MEFVFSLLAFLVVLTPVVFFHELGHFWAARRSGVKVEVFSVGFGRELFGYTDREGTRWRFSLLPLGGYVKMAGDGDPASTPSADAATIEGSFHAASLKAKAFIVAMGPLPISSSGSPLSRLSISALARPLSPIRLVR